MFRGLGKVECCIGRYVALALNERIELSLGPADFLRECRQVHIHGFEKFLEKHLARVKGVLRLSLHSFYLASVKADNVLISYRHILSMSWTRRLMR